MSAIDTFNWIMEESFDQPDEETRQLIEARRNYLFSLRSEDEKVRFVSGLEKEVRAFAAMKKAYGARK